MPPSTSDTRIGGLCAFFAFLLWGGFPLYFKAVSGVPPLEVFAHRILWVSVVMLPVVLVLGRIRLLRTAFSDFHARRQILLAAVLLSGNWLLFIWAISNGHVLQSSLGYYINPLFNVLLGVVVLGERMGPARKVAVAIATTGVGVMIWGLGIFPWIALSLAALFAFYGLVRKQSSVDAITGLLAETMMMLPPVLILLSLMWFGGDFGMPFQSEAGFDDWGLLLLIMASGVVTSLPLVLFTEAAQRLPLSVVGFFQYITPTGHFLLAVFVFEEPFTNWHLASFGLIWMALAVYTSDAIRQRSRASQEYPV